MKNSTIIEKASMTLNDLSNGGRMNPAQANKFIRMVQNTPTILKDARLVQMESDRQIIEKIGFGQRIMRAASEGVALADTDRSKPQTGKVTLNAKEVIAEINLTYDTLENNIEKGNLKEVIMQMLAERAAVDIEELMVNGDTTNATDSYLAQLDGIRKLVKSHIVNNNTGEISRASFKNAKKIIPAKYLRSPQEFRYYTSPSVETEWIDKLGDRQTSLGDSAVEGKTARPFGIPIQSCANLQPYDEAGKDVSDIILTHPKNIILGMSRNISIEVDKDIRTRQFIIVLTAKLDTVFEEEDAVSKIIKVLE
ncbi:phage major capsid protein [Listeria monocytogenes]|uniref:phage major capsid protein n=1 Tax=Listeria monocytogenes TaxID=1639 RepID=UPI0011EA9D80|nr:phage major capsid protein [Listeria monocytogenes]TYU83599.1 phage major capsid protein [Listeria monocytogenes]